jgi:hypothetical protein
MANVNSKFLKLIRQISGSVTTGKYYTLISPAA